MQKDIQGKWRQSKERNSILLYYILIIYIKNTTLLLFTKTHTTTLS